MFHMPQLGIFDNSSLQPERQQLAAGSCSLRGWSAAFEQLQKADQVRLRRALRWFVVERLLLRGRIASLPHVFTY